MSARPNQQSHRNLLLAGIWTIAVLAVACVGTFVFWWPNEGDLYAAIMTVIGQLLIAIPALMLLAVGRARIVSWLAIGCFAASAAASIATPYGSSTMPFWYISYATYYAGLFSLQLSLLQAMTVRDGATRIVRSLAWACGGVWFAGSLIYLFEGSFDKLMGRLLGSLFVFTLALTLITPLVHLLHTRRASHVGEHTLDPRARVEVVCPHCGVHSSVAANTDARCAGCGLGVRITLEEPRCECGYLLYGLTEPTCPECGRDVPEAHQSLAPSAAAETAPGGT